MAIISIPTSVAGVSLPGQLGNLAKGPLNALFAGSGVETLKYPSDLATDPTKSHFVSFSVKEIVPAGFTSSNGTIDGNSLGLGGLTRAASAVGKAISSASGASGLTGLLSAGINLSSSLSNLNNEVGSYPDSKATSLGQGITKGLAITPRTTNPRAVISLYMPDTLNASYNSQYNTLDLATDTGIVQSLRQISQLAGKATTDLDFSSASNLGTSLGTSLGNIVSTDPNALDLATKLAGSKFNLGSTGTVLLKGRGYAINPQVQMIYQGVSLREFQLSFVFTPKSADDSRQINAIIRMFKYHSLPSLQAGSQTSTDSMFLIAPSIFNVDFLINSKQNIYLPKYGDCVLENIDVNYAPNGFAAFDSGAPVQTTLTLSFKETEILDKQKIKSGSLR
jgi:hypothetical protein